MILRKLLDLLESTLFEIRILKNLWHASTMEKSKEALHNFKLIQDRRTAKLPPTSFSPVTSTNVGISSAQKISDF